MATKSKGGTDLFAIFSTDKEKESDGVWVPFAGEGDDLVEFLIARSGNPKHKGRLQSLVKRNKYLLDRNDETAEKKGTEILVESMAEGILLDWRGPVLYQGDALPYSKENAKLLLGLDEFRKWCTDQSESIELYKNEQDEKNLKN